MEETDYDHLEMEYTLFENSEHDWYSLRIRDRVFSASGDPTKLGFLIGKFFEIIENTCRAFGKQVNRTKKWGFYQ